MDKNIGDLADIETVLDRRPKFPLGPYGIGFVRPGDRILYCPEGTLRDSIFADATVLRDNEVAAAFHHESGKEICGDKKPEGSVPIKLNTPFIGERVSYATGSVMFADEDKLYWDANQPFPAERIEDHIRRAAQLSRKT